MRECARGRLDHRYAASSERVAAPRVFLGRYHKAPAFRIDLRPWGGRKIVIRNPAAAGWSPREWPVRLVPALGEITRLLRRELPSRDLAWVEAQARRVAWRHIHDLTEQLLLAVKLGLKTVPGAFMDSIEVDDPGGGTTTMGELLERHAQLPGGGQGIRLLPPGRE